MVPESRYSVTFSCQLSSERPLAATKVSTATDPLVSPWLGTEVRWMSPAAVSSPLVQRPSTYHLVVVPRSVCPAIATSTQVPGGVVAFQEAISSVAPNAVATCGEIQLVCS